MGRQARAEVGRSPSAPSASGLVSCRINPVDGISSSRKTAWTAGPSRRVETRIALRHHSAKLVPASPPSLVPHEPRLSGVKPVQTLWPSRHGRGDDRRSRSRKLPEEAATRFDPTGIDDGGVYPSDPARTRPEGDPKNLHERLRDQFGLVQQGLALRARAGNGEHKQRAGPHERDADALQGRGEHDPDVEPEAH
jgi:hypothetical protein